MKVFVKKIIKSMLNKNNISFYKNINNEKIIELIKLFRPYNLGYNLIRIGNEKDGGYLIPDCLDDIKFCFSIGVDNKFSFEENLFKKGIKSFLSDYSQDISKIPDIFDFEKKNIKSFNDENSLNINDWIETKRDKIKSEKLIFQIDVEGDEYEILSSISEKNLAQIKILIVEFHDLEYSGNRMLYQVIVAVMKKILKKFEVAHIHPNNWKAPSLVNKYFFPSNLEVTFLNRSFVKKKSSIQNLPHKLDFKNVSDRPDIKLEGYWYN
tara:strand:- start:4948 stop:5745 length:798 start_codon:yes stop_codon:yes gene_type:complete